MYAIIESGGKQYRVQPGDVVQVDRLSVKKGEALKFEKVLFVGKPEKEKSNIWLGKPYVDKALVSGEVLNTGRGKKLLVMKFKRRKGYERKKGHRQEYTQVLITEVDSGSGDKESLSAKDKTEQLKKFQSHLKPKGPAFSPKKIKTRKPQKQLAAEPASPKKAATAKPKAKSKVAAKKKKASKKK